MTNLRADYWDVEGTSLHTWAIHLDPTPSRTITGRKGDNPVPLGLDGADHVDKPWAPITFLLAGWISDRAPGGTLSSNPSLRIAQRDANIDTLEDALRGSGGQVTLTKRRYEDSGGATVVAYTREIELLTFDVAYGTELARHAAAVAVWTAEVHAADPWWYTSPGGAQDHLA